MAGRPSGDLSARSDQIEWFVKELPNSSRLSIRIGSARRHPERGGLVTSGRRDLRRWFIPSQGIAQKLALQCYRSLFNSDSKQAEVR